jgi:hypothetical protein
MAWRAQRRNITLHATALAFTRTNQNPRLDSYQPDRF